MPRLPGEKDSSTLLYFIACVLYCDPHTPRPVPYSHRERGGVQQQLFPGRNVVQTKTPLMEFGILEQFSWLFGTTNPPGERVSEPWGNINFRGAKRPFKGPLKVALNRNAEAIQT